MSALGLPAVPVTSPTQRSLALAREKGYAAVVTERWNPFAKIRQDLFGIVDILAIRKNETLAIQACAYSSVSARVTKIANHENTPTLREAGWIIQVWGWHKIKNRWQVRIVDCS